MTMKRRHRIEGVFTHRLTCTSHICYNLTLQRFPFAYFTISCILIRQAALAILRFRKYREFFIKKSKSRNLICISYKGSCWNFDLISSTLSWMNYILGNCDVYMISTLYGNYIFHVSSSYWKTLEPWNNKDGCSENSEEDFFSKTI